MEFTPSKAMRFDRAAEWQNANQFRGAAAKSCDGKVTDLEMPMPAYAPMPNDLPILDSDDTVEVDMRWLTKDRPGLKAKLESAGSDAGDENSTVYDRPTVGSELTATQVIDLLSLGKK
jgi:hypothetical protein